MKFWDSDVLPGDNFHSNLNSLVGASQLLVKLWLAGSLLFGVGKHPQFLHDPKQDFRTAGMPPSFQTVLKFRQPQLWIARAHMPDQLQFNLRILI